MAQASSRLVVVGALNAEEERGGRPHRRPPRPGRETAVRDEFSQSRLQPQVRAVIVINNAASFMLSTRGCGTSHGVARSIKGRVVVQACG
jgi:hypothetical protein